MAKVHTNSEFDDLLAAAFEESAVPYIEAVASTIEGTPNGEAWRDFELVTARAILLSYLLGIAQVLEDAEIAGADLPEPEKVMYAQSDCGANAEGGGGFQPGNTCAGDGDGKDDLDDYRMAHRPNPDGPRLHDLLEIDMLPPDVYDHPEWYVGDPGSLEAKQSIEAIQKARDNPDEMVTIYRSMPKDLGFKDGDWVSLSHEYALKHGMGETEEDDMPVFSMEVPASHVRFAGDDLNEFGYYPPAPARVTSSPEFKTWFKDSKVVDESGEPRVVYHGTGADFDEFDDEHSIGGQHWFTDSKSLIEKGEVGASGTGKIMSLYLSIKNPAGWDEYDKYTLDQLISKGYDGLMLEEDDQTTFVAFSPTQIKSATDNTGAFDPDDPKITNKRKYASNCGSGKEDAPGFQPGNTCAGEGGATDTPEFKTWFGDSKIVDESGEPLVVYHGVKDPKIKEIKDGEIIWDIGFDVFDTEGGMEAGAYFSPDINVARKYGTPIPFYLKATSPIQKEDPISSAPHNADSIYRTRGKSNKIQDAWEIAVFDPSQIKMAVGNTGAFDPDNPKITHSKETYAKDDWPLETGFEDFDRAPFEEAIGLFEERIPKLAENIPGIVKEAKRQASVMALAERLGVVAKLDAQSGAISKALGMHFWVTGVDKKTTISLKNLIADALRGVTPSDKVSLPDFIDHDWLEKSQDLTAARLETIYRTNLQTAYNEGHMASLRAPEVKHVAPLVMIVEIQDPRSRPHHAAMDGYINTVEVIDRLQIRPPNGFNCRGTVRAISWTEADSLGLMKDGEIDQASLDRYNGKRQGYIDRGEYPDPGFDKVTRAA